MPSPAGRGTPERKRSPVKLGAILLVLALCAIAGIGGLAVRARDTPDAVPDQATIECGRNAGSSLVDRVSTGPLGLSLVVNGATPGEDISVFPDNGSGVVVPLSIDESGTGRAHVFVGPGRVRIECGTRRGPSSRAREVNVEAGTGRAQAPVLACAGEEIRLTNTESFSAQGNPLPDALYRAIPGLRSSDVIAGPFSPSRDPRVSSGVIFREGEHVVTFELTSYGNHWFVTYLEACSPSILDPNDPAAGPGGLLATPYELPGLPRCDPYTRVCQAIHGTAEWYQRETGKEVRLQPPIPWAACLPRQPFGCPPKPEKAVIEVLLNPSDYQAFVGGRGCGQAMDDPCA